MVKPNCKGKVELFRYADDPIICCQYEEDAKRIKNTLAKRLGKFRLQLNEDKTKLVSFDKAATEEF
jgi:RNA-directed DNA polymerase